jgi:hypothetical protein
MAELENATTNQIHPTNISEISTEGNELNTEKKDLDTSKNVTTIQSDSIHSSFSQTSTSIQVTRDEAQKVFHSILLFLKTRNFSLDTSVDSFSCFFGKM